MKFRWTDAFATGVDEIDLQHRALLEQVDRLLGAVDADPSAVSRLLDFLGDYALSHFDTEERLMEHHAYPWAEVHREAHAGFVRAFGRIRYDHDYGGRGEGTRELISGWLVEWLKGHILDLDRELGRWLVARGQGGVPHPASSATWVVPSGLFLRVLSVTPGHGLDRAGVEAGDLIVALGGRRVSELGIEQAELTLAAGGAGGLTLTVHPGGDRDRIETRFVPRQAVADPPASR